MKRFAELYAALDATTRTNAKVDALERYFRSAPPADAAWTLYYLAGNKVSRLVAGPRLREWLAEDAELPLWMVEECYDVVGDLAETCALLAPPPVRDDDMPLHVLVEQKLIPMRTMEEEDRRARVRELWSGLDATQRLLCNKLLTGGFRVGVSRALVTRALGRVAGLDPAVIAHRLMGSWKPTPANYERLLAETTDADVGRPYPFHLAYALEDEPATLGDTDAWQLEWKWDGIRAQVVRRRGETLVWSRGEELLTDRFPEVCAAAEALPDGTVVDGEILAWRDEAPLPFGILQTRITRKKVTERLLREAPVTFLAYDLLEHGGEDLRAQPLHERRRLLETLPVRRSPPVEAADWDEVTRLRTEARARGVEGFMLKRRDAPYGVGRRRGDWWKWKVDPFTVDAVLTYAQRGHGRRANLYTDYTFGIWDDGALVTVAKAYSGLTDAEIREVDRFVRRHTTDRFGPVRQVTPELVFELAFDGIQESTRRKVGLALRFPRIARWRRDKKPPDADSLDTVRSLL
ncbi:MAG: ATP-dependent DNA ligase [Planctomycetota bacterium]